MNIVSVLFFAVSSSYAMNDEQLRIGSPRWFDEEPTGFQGCINKAECGADIHPYTSLSQEGLCMTCESKTYPERFTFCFSCRKASHALPPQFCIDCRVILQKLIVEHLKFNEQVEHIQALQWGVSQYLSSIRGFIQNPSIKNVWESPNPIPSQEKKLITYYPEAQAHVKKVCEKYKFFGKQTGIPLYKK